MTAYVNERLETYSTIILSGETESSKIDSIGKILVGIITPSALTSTSFTIQVSLKGSETVFRDYYNAQGDLVTITVGVDRHIGIIPADFANTRFFRLVGSGAEGDDREIKLILRGM